MRLLLVLEAVSDFNYDLMYYSRVQAFIYSLLKFTEYDYLHDKKGFKFFSFSNIYPINEDMSISNGEEKFLLVSSPDKELMKSLSNQLRRLMRGDGLVTFGAMRFKLKSIKIFDISIPDTTFSIYTATPVIVRIQRKYYPIFNIKSDKPYIFWRREYGLRSFITMTKLNLLKKYQEFYGYDPPTLDIYQGIRLRRDHIPIKLYIGNKVVEQVGSMWRFKYFYVDRDLKKTLKFLLDVGIGERNSMGFGFLNLKED